MAMSVRVDSEALTATADAMSDLGAATASTRVGQTLSAAAGALSGTATATALGASGARIDDTFKAIGKDFDALSANLTAAARKYGETDGLSGDAITRVANKMAP